MEDRERLLGLDKPEILWSVADFGSLLHKQGQLVQAEPLLRQAAHGPETGRRR